MPPATRPPAHPRPERERSRQRRRSPARSRSPVHLAGAGATCITHTHPHIHSARGSLTPISPGQAREAQRELLLLSPGDWGALVGFVRSSLRAGGAEAEAEVRAVLAELRGGGGGGGGGDSGGESSAAGGAAAGSAGGGRGPLLAAAELEASLLRLAPGLLDTEEAAGGGEAAGETAEQSPRPASYDPLLEALRAYWRAYSHKQCAVYDVLPYLRALPAASLSALLQQLEAEVGQPPPPDAPQGERRAWLRRFSALGEWRIGGGAAAAQSVDERRQLAAQFVAAHASAADLAAAMDEREVLSRRVCAGGRAAPPSEARPAR